MQLGGWPCCIKGGNKTGRLNSILGAKSVEDAIYIYSIHKHSPQLQDHVNNLPRYSGLFKHVKTVMI